MACALCSNESFDDISEVDAKTGEKLRISLCNNCGLIQQNPVPSCEELKIYYSHSYRLDYKKAYIPKAKHVYRAGKTALQRIEFLKAAGVSEGRLLDVGAGGGEFVYLAGKAGFHSHGIEPNIGYSEYAATEYQSKVLTGQLGDVQEKYDVLTMFHVLEHLPSPLMAFDKLHQSLTEHGMLLIEVPWIETNDASPNNIFFKAHIFYFSVTTLIACASRYFDPVKVDTSANLKILFKRKNAPAPVQLPSHESVVNLKKRILDKGWMEYLFRGKGILKPLRKLVVAMDEGKAKSVRPREILNSMFGEASL